MSPQTTGETDAPLQLLRAPCAFHLGDNRTLDERNGSKLFIAVVHANCSAWCRGVAIGSSCDRCNRRPGDHCGDRGHVFCAPAVASLDRLHDLDSGRLTRTGRGRSFASDRRSLSRSRPPLKFASRFARGASSKNPVGFQTSARAEATPVTIGAGAGSSSLLVPRPARQWQAGHVRGLTTSKSSAGCDTIRVAASPGNRSARSFPGLAVGGYVRFLPLTQRQGHVAGSLCRLEPEEQGAFAALVGTSGGAVHIVGS